MKEEAKQIEESSNNWESYNTSDESSIQLGKLAVSNLNFDLESVSEDDLSQC